MTSLDKRPHLCPDETCECLWANYSRKSYDAGGSHDCFGRMPVAHRVVWRETEHVNDLSHCAYTPFKGHLRFLVNEGDVWLLFLACSSVLGKITPQICENCGPVTHMEGGITKTLDGHSVCRRCQGRLDNS